MQLFKTRIGLLVPPADDWLPPECARIYPNIEFLSRGLGIQEMSARGFDEVMEVIADRSVELKRKGAQAISLMGASLTFYRGEGFNCSVIDAIASVTGLPATSMSRAMIRALRANGIQRVALATAYDDKLNAHLVSFLDEHNVAVTATKGLGLTDIASVRPTSLETIRLLVHEAFELSPSTDGVLISCGGLPTLSLHPELEDDLRVPVVSSFPAGLWDVVQRAGQDPRAQNLGRMFEITASD